MTTTSISVEVTFLRMEQKPKRAFAVLADGYTVDRIRPDVALYRSLYDGVGQDYCWWMRRTLDDAALGRILENPRLSVHILHRDRQAEGFYELERLPDGDINLAYFGLLPAAIGNGLGRALLDHAIEAAWAERPRGLRVNTCTADHPRALPTYLKAGFSTVNRVQETWDIPDRLGFVIPERLRAGQ